MTVLQLTQASFGEPGVATTPLIELELQAGELAVVEVAEPGRGALLARGCVGLAPLVSGAVLLFGEDLAPRVHEDLVRLRLRASVASPDLPLLSNLTLRENVALPLLMRGEDRAYVFPTVDGVFARLGLEQHASHRPDELPPRSAALAGIARAMAVPAELIILDDPPAVPAVRDLVRERVERGTGVLVISPSAHAFPDATHVIPLLDT